MLSTQGAVMHLRLRANMKIEDMGSEIDVLMIATGGLHSIFFPNELSRVLTGEYWCASEVPSRPFQPGNGCCNC